MNMLTVYDMKGSSVGDFEIADSLLTLEKGSQAVHDTVVRLLARRRAGTASTLRKGEVAGSNRKPWRQKGTGRARAGYRQSPIWRGGGVAFGPHPRSYGGDINKKVMRLAFRRAFSEKVAASEIRIVSELMLPQAKTKLFVLLLQSLGIKGPALFVDDKVERNVVLASRNVPNVEVVTARDVNVYHLLRYPTMVVSESGMKEIKARLEGKTGMVV